MTLSSSVPQRSVLGPTLWNVLYDDHLRLPLPDGVEYLAFADDIALVATAEKHLLRDVDDRGREGEVLINKP